MFDYCDKAEDLLERIRDNAVPLEMYRSTTLLTGIDYVCRVIHGLMMHDFDDLRDFEGRKWLQVPSQERNGVIFWYRELGRQGGRLSDHLEYEPQYYGGGKELLLDDLIHDSGIAQGVASRRTNDNKLDAKIMKTFAQTTLSAIISIHFLLVLTPKHKHSYYAGNIREGLALMARVISRSDD